MYIVAYAKKINYYRNKLNCVPTLKTCTIDFHRWKSTILEHSLYKKYTYIIVYAK